MSLPSQQTKPRKGLCIRLEFKETHDELRVYGDQNL